MSLKKTLDRNRQMKKIAQSVAQKWEKATIYSIDGDRANIRLGSSANLIRHVEVTGDASLLVPGQEVVIVWKDKRPVVVMAGTALAASLSQEGVSEQTPLFIKLYQSVAQSAASAVETYLTFDTVLADTVGWWDPTAPDRIIVQESGLYFISVDISFASNATGVREAKIYVNDNEIGRSQAAAGSSAVVVHNAVFAMLDKGDIVQADMYQNSGGALATVINTNFLGYPTMTLVRVRDTVTVQQTGDTTILNQGTGGGGTSSPHAATHQQGGSDMINVDGLRGVLAEAQNADKLRGRTILDAAPNDGNVYVWNNFMQSWVPADLTGLKGVLADPQNANKLLGRNISTDDVYDGHILQWSEADQAWMPRVNRATLIPVHASAHQDGGGDEINVTGLSGVLADPQNANKLQGRPVTNSNPQGGQALVWNATSQQWEPATVSGGSGSTKPASKILLSRSFM